MNRIMIHISSLPALPAGVIYQLLGGGRVLENVMVHSEYAGLGSTRLYSLGSGNHIRLEADSINLRLK